MVVDGVGVGVKSLLLLMACSEVGNIIHGLSITLG